MIGCARGISLGGAFLAGCHLPTALQFELPGVLSLQSFLLDLDVTLHQIHGDVDYSCGPVKWVHPEASPAGGHRGFRAQSQGP